MHVELATICTSSPIRGRPRLVVRPRSECRNAEQGPRFPANTHSHTHTHLQTDMHKKLMHILKGFLWGGGGGESFLIVNIGHILCSCGNLATILSKHLRAIL